jgi:hypothetical protein
MPEAGMPSQWLIENPSITPSFPLNLRGMKGGYLTYRNNKNFYKN